LAPHRAHSVSASNTDVVLAPHKTHESDLHWRDFYDRWAPRYDWALRIWALLAGFSDENERWKMVSRLELKPGQRVLEVGVGTGSNLPLMGECAGPDGMMVGLDVSIGMLRQCEKKVQCHSPNANLTQGEAAHLPFADDAFDAVLQFGVINESRDKRRAIQEMMRVAKPGAKIVIGDEGVNPGKPASLRNRLISRLSPLRKHDPPTDSLPPEAKDVHMVWFRAGRCYLIDFVNPQ
jgi:ubiquinone/menaquinone biosynthesis C-methylase UbiE